MTPRPPADRHAAVIASSDSSADSTGATVAMGAPPSHPAPYSPIHHR